MKIALASIGFVLLFTAVVAQASVSNAQTSTCQIIYGGGEICPPSVSFSVSKLVQKPGTGDFVENLSINDPKHAPSQEVTFQVNIKNTGTTKLTKTQVVDTFPAFLSFVSGAGNFDANTRNLTFTVESIDPGATVSFTIVGKTVEEKLLPLDQGIVCIINQAKATEEHGVTATDTSQLCIEKKVLGAAVTPQVVTTTKGAVITPPTGAEFLSLLGLIPTGIAGLVLKRYASFKKSGKQK